MPGQDGKDEAVPDAEVEESDKEDDKLYCVCKTRYDEDRVMIACDRCAFLAGNLLGYSSLTDVCVKV